MYWSWYMAIASATTLIASALPRISSTWKVWKG